LTSSSGEFPAFEETKIFLNLNQIKYLNK